MEEASLGLRAGAEDRGWAMGRHFCLFFSSVLPGGRKPAAERVAGGPSCCQRGNGSMPHAEWLSLCPLRAGGS